MSKTKRLLSLVLALSMVFALFVGGIASAEGEDDDAAAPVVDATFNPSVPVSYSDLESANLNYDLPIQVFSKVGLVKGTGANMLEPTKTLTRAEGAALLARDRKSVV